MYCYVLIMPICAGSLFTYTCMYTSSPEEDDKSPGALVTGSCRPAAVDARNQTWSSATATCIFNYWGMIYTKKYNFVRRTM